MDEFDFYNKHYIRVDDQHRIVDGWSDGPHRDDKSTEGAICINEKGGYQFRLIINGVETEENPALWTMDGIPLYKYEGGKVVERTEAEIEEDRAQIPPPPPSETERLRAEVESLNGQLDSTMMALCDVYELVVGGDV